MTARLSRPGDPVKTIAFILALAVLAAPLTSEAQPARKVPRIGYLILTPLAEKPSPERAAWLWTIFGAREFVAAGGLMSYGANVPETAKALGITIPPSVLLRTDQVVQ